MPASSGKTGHAYGPHSLPLGLGICGPRQIPGCGMWRTKHRGLQPALPSPGSASSTEGNRCVEAAEACTADEQCQQLRSEYVAQCLGRAGWRGPGSCVRSRCRRALRRFFARGPPALTHALLFCRCEGPACAERRRQTFAPACAFSGPELAPPSCLKPLDHCERSRLCRCVRGGLGRSPASGRAQAPSLCLPGLMRSRARLPRPLSGGGGPAVSARLRRPRRYAGRPPAGGAAEADSGGPSQVLGVPAGTVVTPNYLDNVSARVAPWCGCEASGNRREECEAFRKLFTRNPCLGEGAGEPGQPRTSMAQSRLPGLWGPLKCLRRVVFGVGDGQCARAMVHGWKSEDNLSVPFYHVGPRDSTGLISFGGKYLCLLSHLAG